MSTPYWPMQLAIEQAINGDAAVSDLITGFYSIIAPTGSKKPYIVLGKTIPDALVTYSSDIHRGRDIISIWARDKAEVMELFNKVYDALHKKKLPVEGFTHVWGRLRLVDILLDEDNVSYQGVCEYTWTVQ